MYHCGTPMVLRAHRLGHVRDDVVEPRGGYPTKVDREYAVIQSEFYTSPIPRSARSDGVPLYVLDGERVRTKAPTYTVFNGRYNGMVDSRCPPSPASGCACSCMNVGSVQHLQLPRGRHHLRPGVVRGNPDNQWRGIADRAARAPPTARSSNS
jgi:nitrite reductase (NO-forming)